MPLMPWDKISWKMMFTVFLAVFVILIIVKLISNIF